MTRQTKKIKEPKEDFAAPTQYRLKLKKSKNRKKKSDPCSVIEKKTVEYESNGDINWDLCTC